MALVTRKIPKTMGLRGAAVDRTSLREVETRLTLDIHPSRSGNVVAGVKEQLNNSLMRYNEQHGGIVLLQRVNEQHGGIVLLQRVNEQHGGIVLLQRVNEQHGGIVLAWPSPTCCVEPRVSIWLLLSRLKSRLYVRRKPAPHSHAMIPPAACPSPPSPSGLPTHMFSSPLPFPPRQVQRAARRHRAGLLQRVLRAWSPEYSEQHGGIVLAYSNVLLFGRTAAILTGLNPYLHVSLSARLLLFAPRPGAFLGCGEQ
ncbi:unnamed protein product, partial [Closterium sp. Naga37s-1]